MLYEALLLFGVVFISGWLLDTLTQSRHALMLRHTRQAWLFLVIGAYFIFFWRRTGQTLAMKTWRIRLVPVKGSSISLTQAIFRYLLAWLWFLPAMAIDYFFGIKGWPSIGLIVVGMMAWLVATRFDKNRQFPHDRIVGTRLVDVQVAARPNKST
jgi:uncharacterized RDD family membrane protein YckC